jgi:DNA-directed RNA polymerase subunit RPC12/RpoP
MIEDEKIRNHLKKRANELREAILSRKEWICPSCKKEHSKNHLIEQAGLAPRTFCPHCGFIIDPLYCPDCGCTYFLEGPHGGLALNIKCEVCGKEWWYGPLFGIRELGIDDKR